MATNPEAILSIPTPRKSRKRAALPKKSRAELASEFEALPLTALAIQAQVAAFLNCSEAKLERDRWAGNGIGYLKTGRNVRYRKADVLAYLKGKERTSTTDKGRIGAAE